MTKVLIISLIILAGVSAVFGRARQVPKVSDYTYQINYKSIMWPGKDTMDIFTKSGRHDRKNIIATKLQLFEDQIFLAFPRLKPGVPVTLGVIKQGDKCGYDAFPCWALQEEGNCEALQNVVDIAVDDHGVLWALDTGIVNTLTQPVFRCDPKVVGIDIRGKQVVKVINLNHLIIGTSRLQYIIVEYANDGKVYLYISDASGRAIIVYDVLANSGFRVSLPKAVNLGNSKRDVLNMVLVQKSTCPELYFTYLSSSRVFSIRTAYLRQGASGSTDISDVGTKLNSIVLLGTNGGSVIFFRYKGQSDVYLWDTNTTFGPENFVIVQKGDECHLPTSIATGPEDSLWTLESNFQDFIQNTVSSGGASMIVHPLVKNC